MENILLAIMLGGAFGFALDRVGATNPGYIIRMLNLTDLHLAKTILMGIGVAAVLLFSSLLAGLVDPAHLSVKAAYSGVFVGGILLGLGFAMSGYCPGTGLAAMATGRIDALIFVLGGLTGAAAYMATHATVAGTGLLEGIAGGKATVGSITGTDFPGLFAISGAWIGFAMGVIFIAIAAALPARLRG